MTTKASFLGTTDIGSKPNFSTSMMLVLIETNVSLPLKPLLDQELKGMLLYQKEPSHCGNSAPYVQLGSSVNQMKRTSANLQLITSN